MDLEFKAIYLTKHRDLVIKFRADSFFTSFGPDRDFWGEDGQVDKRYLDILAKKLFPIIYWPFMFGKKIKSSDRWN